jgi:hypothetical protein
MPHFQPPPQPLSAPPSRLNRFLLTYCLVASIALYQCFSAPLIAHEDLSQGARNALAAGCLLLVAAVGLVPLRTGGWGAVYGHEHHPIDADTPEPREGHGDDDAGDAPAARRAAFHRPLAGGDAASGSPRVARRATGAREQQVALPAPLLAGGGRGGGGGGGKPSSGAGLAPLDEADGERLPLLLASAGAGGGGADFAVGGTGLPPAAAALPLAAPPGGEPVGPLPSLGTLQMAATLDFWCIFLQFCVGTGAALALLNNLGQFVVALGGERGGQVVLVSLFSVANAGGRLLMGYVPEHFLHARGTPRPAFLLAVAAAMVRRVAGAGSGRRCNAPRQPLPLSGSVAGHSLAPPPPPGRSPCPPRSPLTHRCSLRLRRPTPR